MVCILSIWKYIKINLTAEFTKNNIVLGSSFRVSKIFFVSNVNGSGKIITKIGNGMLK